MDRPTPADDRWPKVSQDSVFLQTLELNKMKTLLWSEEDCFPHLCYYSEVVWYQGDSVVAPDALTQASVCCLWSSAEILTQLFLRVLPLFPLVIPNFPLISFSTVLKHCVAGKIRTQNARLRRQNVKKGSSDAEDFPKYKNRAGLEPGI